MIRAVDSYVQILLKIYIYGYLNKTRSNQKLETEIKRNILRKRLKKQEFVK